LMSAPRNIYLIDGNSYIYRAYHAIKGLTNSRGFPTNAVYGFTNILLKMLRDRQPDAVVVAFDSPAPTERHQVYEEYKSQRPETPDDLVVQMPYVREIVKALNLPVYEMPGYEADDILATLARLAEQEGFDVYIVTGDKDMLQVLSGKIRVYDPMKQKEITHEDVLRRFGLPPERIPEVMALTGDTTDNIPGVKGIGEKTAVSILRERSLDEIIQDPSIMENPRIRRLIEKSLDDIRLSRELARVVDDIPLEFNPAECRLGEPDYDRLLSLFRELEFGSLVRMIPVPGRKLGFRTLEDIEALRREVSSCLDVSSSGRFTFLSVTEDERVSATGRMHLVGTGFIGKDSPFYLPLGHRYLGVPEQVPLEGAVEVLGRCLENRSVAKTGHDLKREMHIYSEYGVKMAGLLEDIMVADYLLNPNRPNHTLGEIALEYLSERTEEPDEFWRKRSPSEIRIEEMGEYIAGRVSIISDLREKLFRRLEEEGLSDLYYRIEMPLINVLFGMERIGVRIDTEKLRELSGIFEDDLRRLKEEIYNLAGEEFNINSPKQLGRVLFEKLGLPPMKKTKTGYSTDVSVLTELAREHDLPEKILRWRSLSKLKSTYVDSLPKLINPGTGRIHTSFNQTVTATGRLSSSDPNLQNIPVRGDWGQKIREAFVPEDGFSLLSADYSQIELRVLAHLSGDAPLIEAFRKDVDVHSVTASEIFGVPEGQVTQEMRRVAKTINFGVIYGISPYGLSDTLGRSQEEAGEYIERYFEGHPQVKEYFDRVIADARRLGYVRTLFGRKRPLPELKSANRQQRLFGERMAMNAPIQGTAADLIKLAMISIRDRLQKEGLRSRMILQVHDELLFEVAPDEVELMRGLVREEMEGAAERSGVELRVPLRVEIGTGPDWASAHT